jgi:hypothetical protein
MEDYIGGLMFNDGSKLNYIDVPGVGECLSGVESMIYCKWMTGARVISLRGGVLKYEIDGCPERVIKPVWVKDHGFVFPTCEIHP